MAVIADGMWGSGSYSGCEIRTGKQSAMLGMAGSRDGGRRFRDDGILHSRPGTENLVASRLLSGLSTSVVVRMF